VNDPLAPDQLIGIGELGSRSGDSSVVSADSSRSDRTALVRLPSRTKCVVGLRDMMTKGTLRAW
jgi:hypothetical protein